jgi:hypothetical protein
MAGGPSRYPGRCAATCFDACLRLRDRRPRCCTASTCTSRRARPRDRRATGAGKSTVVKLLLRCTTRRRGHPARRRRPARPRAPDLRSAPSGSSARTCSCSTAPCARTSPTAEPDARGRDRAPPPRWPRRTSSSRRSPGLRHGRRRARPEALRRAAPAPLDRPRHPADPPCWCSTRPPRGRQRDRGRDPALARAGRTRPHDHRDRPPALHRPARRPHPRARARPGRRGRHPRRAGAV